MKFWFPPLTGGNYLKVTCVQRSAPLCRRLCLRFKKAEDISTLLLVVLLSVDLKYIYIFFYLAAWFQFRRWVIQRSKTFFAESNTRRSISSNLRELLTQKWKCSHYLFSWLLFIKKSVLYSVVVSSDNLVLHNNHRYNLLRRIKDKIAWNKWNALTWKPPSNRKQLVRQKNNQHFIGLI